MNISRTILLLFFLNFIFYSCKEDNHICQNRIVIINGSDIEKEMDLFKSSGIQLFNIETLDSNGNHKFIKKCDTAILKVTYRSFLYRNYNPKISLSKFYHTNYKLIRQRDKYIIVTNDSTELIGFSVWLKNNNVKFKSSHGRCFDNYELSANVLLVYE